MFSSLTDFLAALLRATVALSLSAGIAWTVLESLKPQSARLTRLIWWLVLLQGIILLRIPVAIPWYAAITPAAAPAPDQTVGFSSRTFNFDNGQHRPASVVAQEADAPIAWQPIVFGAWLAGVGMVLVWWAVVYTRVVRCGGRGQTPTEEWLSEWHNLVGNARVGASIPLLITENTGPLLVWRPRGARMLVPRRLWETLGSQQRLAILRHELAHFRRGDLWKSAVARLMALAHWFNPLVWWVVKNLDECAEWLCDDEAAGANGNTAAEYAEVLLRLGQKPRNHGIWATAMRGGRLHRRIRRVLTPLPQERSIMKKFVVVAIPAVLIAFHLVRIELVAKAQATNPASPTTDSAAAKAPGQPESGIPIRGNYLRNGGLGALGLPVIQKELGIEKGDSQDEAIQELNSTFVYENQSTLTKLHDEHRDDTKANRDKAIHDALMALYAKEDRDLKNLLKPEQIARLRQIALQDAGANALADPEVVKELGITKDQQVKLAALYADVREQQLQVFAPDVKETRNTDSIVQKLKDIASDRDKRGNEILTKEQQQKFAELKGKPFDLSTLPPQYAGRGPRMPFGFRRGGLMELALMDPVMKELGIDKDAPQVPELRKLAETYFAETGKEFQRMRHDQIELELANPFRIAPTVQAKIDPELKKLLTPEQFTRLRQINWQNEGVAALYDPAIEESLEITSDQQKQLSDLNYENQRKHTRLLNPRDGEPRLSAEEIQKKGAELNAERDWRINEILTKTQQEKFTELKGKPFDLALLRVPASGSVRQCSGQKSDEKKSDR